MNKYKVCVYAISKDEEVNVKDWYESMKEADEVYVLDTGSKDKTVELLKELGVNVRAEIINPWRFDIARNKSLDLVPIDTDICICTDLDERFEPGWRNKLERLWNESITRISYKYNWAFDEFNNPSTTFYLNKIHTRKDYIWTHPVHEVLTNINNNELQIVTDEIVLNHHQLKKDSRSDYLPLLELSVKEHPEDDRNVHYLGREYMYYNMNEKAIKTLHNHLNLKTAIWKDERCASMRYIARCYERLGYQEEADLWYEKAIKEAPYLRESYVDYAFFLYNNKDYKMAIKMLDKAFIITDKSKSYINEVYAWDYQIYDLYSICAYYLNKKDIAKTYNEIALSLNPNNQRLINNKLFFDKSSV